MNSPVPEQFEEFYKAATLAIAELELAERRKREPDYQPNDPPSEKSPFPWQKRLAHRVCSGNWPRAIALPTAAGKTACIDIAVFALACRAKGAPRRIFFVVDRRVVVDQAYEHAKKLAKVLRDEKTGILKAVADMLRDIAEEGWRDLSEKQQREIHPLDVYALRGGMYRESAWARSPLQPTVIASTVDQIGSRLLFRGYGVSNSMKPVHAGLVGNDSLILLDEAHCARPFDQTMQAVEKYREWGEPNPAPFRYVSITATPREGTEREEANADDLSHPVLGARINASKPAKLVIAEKAKGKEWNRWGPPLVEKLAEQARGLMGQDLGRDEKGNQHTVRAVGIIVNRVATARRLAEVLRTSATKKGVDGPQPDVILLTGRMRPLDRDRVLARLEPLFSGKGGDVPPTFVVATQCLEVGADLDFHALVTECASLDALRQRFGRLNRVAVRPSAKAVIVIRTDQTEDSSTDPVYGASLANTWKWLRGDTEPLREEFDFGVSAVSRATQGVDLAPLNADAPDAPLLFPAHLDCWVQTHPIPTPDPDPALWLHGPKESRQPDVQVVFRSDLGTNENQWAGIVSLCPPSSSEAVSVPISVFKKWLAGELVTDDTADVEGDITDAEPEVEEKQSPKYALRWRGPLESDDKTKLVSHPKEVTPTDTYVVPCDALEAATLGDFPEGGVADYSMAAFQRSRDRALLRLEKLVIPEDVNRQQETELIAAAIAELCAALDANSPEWQRRAVEHFTTPENLKRREVDVHPLGGVIVAGKNRLHQFDPTYLDDSEPDESFYGGRAVTLEEHSQGVADYAKRFAVGCGLDATLYEQAGLWHDTGKLDSRFQAMLKRASPRTAVGTPWAKSARMLSKEEVHAARTVHKYPAGARHELLSAALVSAKATPANDLLLHLIATHHGSARPFANAVEENDAASVPFKSQKLFEQSFELPTAAQQIREWNAELPERFWRVVRKYGWWGAAYHETVFRLADHAESAAEQDRDEAPATYETTTWVELPAQALRPKQHSLSLTGLDGENPLAFLTALGTFLVCDQLARSPKPPSWLSGRVALTWGTDEYPNAPVLHFVEEPPPSAEFAEFLATKLARSVEEHPSAWVIDMLERGFAKDAERDFNLIKQHVVPPLREDRFRLDWVTALSCESAINADSQLQTVRCDYLVGNVRSLMAVTTADHIWRSLFHPWDFADGLSNQSLHWEPSEDRRHAYQWYQPTSDPTRKRRGGMVGANRLALEAWPLFPSFPDGPERVRTRGFRGNRSANTFWTWPLWYSQLTPDGVASILSVPELQEDEPDEDALSGLGLTAAFRSQRILVGKTPNLTPAQAVV